MWLTTQDAIPVWLNGSVSGPLNGVATVHGRFYWFEIAETTLDGSPSGERYLLFEMTPKRSRTNRDNTTLWSGNLGPLSAITSLLGSDDGGRRQEKESKS